LATILASLVDSDSTITADAYVTIKNGTLKGATQESNNGKTFYGFKGIPFAKPPVGEFRFAPPQPLTDGWGEEIYDATRIPPSCPQFLTALSPASEDCLYLNVFTPRRANETANPLPVMFYIYGGGFALGDSVIYGPRKLLAHDVVYVVPHYRLGALGFLSTGDEVIPGNNGMKDVVQALRWVQENIAAFGGDPNKVTVFGESAGSAGAIMTLISPLAKGLFHRVIAQSGTPLSHWAMDRTPWESAQRYAATLKCPTDTSQNLAACLRSKTWEELARASFEKLITDFSKFNLGFEATAPVIEPDLPGAFLSQDPLKILQEGEIPNVPVMLGAVQHEGSAILAAAYSLAWGPSGDADDPDFIHEKMMPSLLNALGVNELTTGGAPISQSLILAYLPDSPRTNFTEIGAGVTDMLSVALFKAPVLRTAELLAKRNPGNVYLYSFEYEGFNSLWNLLFDLLFELIGMMPPPLKHGVMHGDDIQYLFPVPFIIVGNDRTFSDMVCTIWTDFALTGNPTPKDDATWPKWPAYSAQAQNYYKLVLNPEVKVDYTKSWRQGV
jgi:carboxylesterase type B